MVTLAVEEVFHWVEVMVNTKVYVVKLVTDGSVKEGFAVLPPARVIVGPTVWVHAYVRSPVAKEAALLAAPASVTFTPGRSA